MPTKKFIKFYYIEYRAEIRSKRLSPRAAARCNRRLALSLGPNSRQLHGVNHIEVIQLVVTSTVVTKRGDHVSVTCNLVCLDYRKKVSIARF